MPELTVRASPARQRGFTLAELAVVMVIIAVLMGGLLMPLGARMEARKRNETAEALQDIEQALIGFAIVNGRLPCPSTQRDPTQADFGREDASCATGEGLLPWRTLGVAEADAWQGVWRYRVLPAFAAATTTIRATAPLCDTGAAIEVIDHAGNDITPFCTAEEASAVAVVVSTGANREADGANAAAGARYEAGEATARYDDLVMWLGRPVLIARLAQAGRL